MGDGVREQQQGALPQFAAPPVKHGVKEGPGTSMLRGALGAGRPATSYVSQLLLTYPAERNAMIELLQQTLGNGYVRSVFDATPELAGPGFEPLGAEAYWKKYGRRTLEQVQSSLMRSLELEIAIPGLTLPASESGPFLMYAFGQQLLDTSPAVVSQLLDARLYDVVDNVRAVDELGTARDAFEPQVADRITERLGLAIRHAVERLALPYARARAAIVRGARQPVFGPVDAHAGDRQPSPTSLGARSLVEHRVAEALCFGFATFDESKFSVVYATAPDAAAKPVALELERGAGDWTSVRTMGPAQASAADVAFTLFGSPTFEKYVVGAGTRFSFAFPPGVELAEPYQSQWEAEMLGDGANNFATGVAENRHRDPLDGLDPAVADERALAAATGEHVDGAGSAPVLQRFDMIEDNLASIVAVARPLGVAGLIEPLRVHIGQRRAQCMADPAQATKWNAHSLAQLDFLVSARSGFDTLMDHLSALGLHQASTVDGDTLVGDVEAVMNGPAGEVANAFGSAVAAADQLDIARARLQFANERMQTLPVDLIDRMLSVVRGKIAATNHVATEPMAAYEQSRMAQMEQRIQGTVSQIRASVMNGDGNATLKLKELQSQISMLDLQSTLGSTLSAIHLLKEELHDAESWLPDDAREGRIHDQLQAAMQPWRDVAESYNKAWEAGHATDPAWIAFMHGRVDSLRASTKLPLLIDKVSSFATDEAKRQRWIAIGLMIAAALAAAVTGGLGSAAVGGGIAGALVGATFESLTFTSITSTLRTDQTFGGFMAELAVNFATFGGLRLISEGAKLAAAGRALTLSEKLGEMTLEGLWMVASVKAQEIIETQMAGGGQVSAQSAATVFGEQMLISFAGRAIGRIAAFAKLMREANLEKLQTVRKALAAQAPVENLAKLVQGGTYTVGEELVRTDTAAMRSEEQALNHVAEIANDPAAAAREGIHLTPEQHMEVKQLAAGAGHELAERDIADLMKHTEVHGDQVVAEAPVYAELLEKHRKQGGTISISKDSAGHDVAHIVPKRADGTSGASFTMRSRAGTEVEEILAQKKLPNSARVDEYLAKRAGERAAAVSDLRQVNNAQELDALFEKHLGPSVEKQTAQVRSAFGAAPPSDAAIGELAKVPGIAAHLPALVARGVATTEALSAALAKVPHWSNDARLGLVKLAASADANAIRVFAKLSTHLDISGTDSWTLLVSRELHVPGKILDYEASLEKAIELQPSDPTVAMEVDYVDGKRVSKAERKALQADPAKFETMTHKNVDVEAEDARHEMKRVAPDITDTKKLIKQVSEGATKLTTGKVPGLRSGLPGAKKNIVDVRFDDKIKIPNYDEAALRARIEDWIANNRRNMRDYVDEIAIHAEFDGKAVDFVLPVN